MDYGGGGKRSSGGGRGGGGGGRGNGRPRRNNGRHTHGGRGGGGRGGRSTNGFDQGIDFCTRDRDRDSRDHGGNYENNRYSARNNDGGDRPNSQKFFCYDNKAGNDYRMFQNEPPTEGLLQNESNPAEYYPENNSSSAYNPFEPKPSTRSDAADGFFMPPSQTVADVNRNSPSLGQLAITKPKINDSDNTKGNSPQISVATPSKINSTTAAKRNKESTPKLLPASTLFTHLKFKKEISNDSDNEEIPEKVQPTKEKIQSDPETTSDESTTSSSESETGDEPAPVQTTPTVLDTINKPKSSAKTNDAPGTLNAVMKKKIKKEPGDNKTKKSSSSSSDDSESDVESSDEKSSDDASDEDKTEEDVVCLGKLEKFQDLVDDDDEVQNEIQTVIETCILCDTEGHLSFACQMICRNCGGKYHNLKSCPKPANLSVMLQTFLEYCLSQCCQYNPEQRFQYKTGLVQNDMLPATGIPQNSPMESNGSFQLQESNAAELLHKAQKRRKKSSNNSAVDLKVSRRKMDNDSSETDSSSSETTVSSRQKRKRSKQNNGDSRKGNKTAYPPNVNLTGNFAPTVPFTGFNTTGAGFNPMMAFSQMMGFNPAMQFNTKS